MKHELDLEQVIAMLDAVMDKLKIAKLERDGLQTADCDRCGVEFEQDSASLLKWVRRGVNACPKCIDSVTEEEEVTRTTAMSLLRKLTNIDAMWLEISKRHYNGHGKQRDQAKNKAVIRRLARRRLLEFMRRYDEGDE